MPVFLSWIILTTLVYSQARHYAFAQDSRLAKTFTSYLAMTSAQYLVNQDRLGINVILNQMYRDKMFDFASVYDGNDQLVAQAGERDADALISNHEVTFQDSTTGYVQTGFSRQQSSVFVTKIITIIALVHSALAVLIASFIWLAADFFTVWVFGRTTLPTEETKPADELEAESEVPELEAGALLVLKIEPARLTETHRELMLAAAGVYGGKPVDGVDEIAVQFRQDQANFSAVCAGLLIQTLVERLGKPLKFKLGLHWADDFGDLDQALKHTSYLASISEQGVLVSKYFVDISSTTNQDHEIYFAPYRSSLAPDGEVFEAESGHNQSLISQQAEQLLSNR